MDLRAYVDATDCIEFESKAAFHICVEFPFV